MNQSSTRTIGQASIDTQTLVNRLRIAQIGELVSYGDLSALIGRQIQQNASARSCLRSARIIVLRKNNIAFEVVRNEGVKRLNDIEAVNSATKVHAHIGRSARRGRRVVMVADYDLLPIPMQARRNIEVARFNMESFVASERGAKRIESAIRPTQSKPPSLAETLVAFQE